MKEAFKQMLKDVFKSGEKNRRRYIKICHDAEKPCYSPNWDIETRWNSTFEMFESGLKQQITLSHFLHFGQQDVEAALNPCFNVSGVDYLIENISRDLEFADDGFATSHQTQSTTAEGSSSQKSRDPLSRMVSDLAKTNESYDVLGFWKTKENQFPVLSRMALDILSVQASSVASESAFSTSGRILSIRRTRLTAESLEMCMCLKDHLDAHERRQHTTPLELPLDVEEGVFNDEVQMNEATQLTDQEIALDASSDGSFEEPPRDYMLSSGAEDDKTQDGAGELITRTKSSRPQLRSTQMKDKVVPNNSHVKNKKTKVEDHHRISSISNKTKSVTASTNSLKSRTLNVNVVCATCGKCVFNSNHDACVSKYLNDVNARTKKPKVVPISTRKPKSQANKSVATPHKKTVASESTTQKSKSYYRMLYEKTSKAWKWWIEQQCPSGYKWVPKTKKKWVPKVRNENVQKRVSFAIDNASRITNIVQLILFIVDSGCTKHMTGNLKLLCNFVEKYLGTVRFGNDKFAPILGYRDLVQGNITINGVYYVKGLNYNLFLGNDLLTNNHGSDLYTISLQETTSSTPIYFMAKASPNQAWLWHRRLSHINFDYINLISKKDIVIGLPKLKYVKDQLCSSCKLSKAKRSSFMTKAVPSLKGQLNLLHMDLCGPLLVESINGKKYILVIVDDYSRYTWTLFLRSKDETPEVLKDFLRMIQCNLQA
ncbi:retrovirus-related pol polyprotein from transposon TNT 1-94 [Tanacetum coccineum]